MATPKFAPRPDQVQVGNTNYDIQWLNGDEWTAARLSEEAAGLTYADEGLIYIKLISNAPESHYQGIVLHEILHAIWDSTMITHYHMDVNEGDREEFLVGVQAPALLTVMRVNPHLMKYLMCDGTVRR